ncbi:MAG: AsmA family protein [Pseudomonadota bacterium]
MRLVRVFLGILVVLSALGAAGFAMMPSSAELRELVATEFRTATGRELRIGGIAWSLTPTPHVTLRDVAVANPPWARRASLVEARELDVRFDLLALTREELKVTALTVLGLQLNLERDRGNRRTWLLDVGGSGTDQGAPNVPYTTLVERVEIEDLSVEFLSPDSRHTAELTAIDVEGVSPTSHRLAASGQIGALPVSLKGEVGNLLAMLSGGSEALTMEMTASLEDLSLQLDGSVDANGVDARVVVSGSVPDMAGLAEHARGAQLALSARVLGQWPRMQVQALEAAFDREGLRQQLAGAVEVDFGAEPMHVSGTLRAPSIALLPPGDNTQTSKDSMVALPTIAPIDLDLRLSVAKLPTDPELTDLSARLLTRGSSYRVTAFRAMAAGTPVAGEALVQTAAEPGNTNVSVKLSAHGLPVEAVLTDSDLVAPLDIELDLRANGQALAAWAGSATGSVRVVAGQGRVRARAAETLVGGLPAIFDALFAEESEWVAMNCAVAAWRLDDGTAQAQALVLDTQHTTIVGEGSVDLGARRLSMLVKPFPKSATLNLAVPVRISGPLDAPQFALDEAATLRRVGGALAGIVFPPALLATFADLGYDAGGCLPARLAESTSAGQRILDGVASTAASVASETGKVVTVVGEGAGSAVNEAGEAASAAGKAAADAVESTLEEVGKGLKSLFGN